LEAELEVEKAAHASVLRCEALAHANRIKVTWKARPYRFETEMVHNRRVYVGMKQQRGMVRVGGGADAEAVVQKHVTPLVGAKNVVNSGEDGVSLLIAPSIEATMQMKF
jgi:hypothetical protein